MPGVHRDRVRGDRRRRQNRLRRMIQLVSAVFFNGYAAGFAGGKIFTGPTKGVCVPVLNCYSCPGALGACPIGSLQALLGGARGGFPFYVLGVLMLFGVVCGRLLCGFLCPFGFLQDLLHKIPTKKLHPRGKLDRAARRGKYAVLVILVVALPLVTRSSYGTVTPWFCKLICPAGTLEGGIPLVLTNEKLRALAGWLFGWKTLVLVLVAAGAVLIHRFFCRYLCPLGAIYALFNRFALYQMKLEGDKCVKCGACAAACPMGLDVTAGHLDSGECIRCGMCKAVCPTDAIGGGFTVDRRP